MAANQPGSYRNGGLIAAVFAFVLFVIAGIMFLITKGVSLTLELGIVSIGLAFLAAALFAGYYR